MALVKRAALLVVAPLRRALVQPVLHAVHARAAQTDRIAAAGFEGLEDSVGLLARQIARLADPVPATVALAYAIHSLRHLKTGARVAVIDESSAIRAALDTLGFRDGDEADAVLMLDAGADNDPASRVRSGGLVVIATGDDAVASRVLAGLDVLDRRLVEGTVLATARRPAAS